MTLPNTKNTMTNESLYRLRLTYYPLIASMLTIAVGLMVLTGWIFDVTLLKSVHPTFVSMKPNTALAFILAGIALWILGKRNDSLKTLGHALALMVTLIGMLTLSEYLFKINLGIDTVLFQDVSAVETPYPPGRMVPTTALNFIFIGISLILAASKKVRAHRIVQYIVTIPIAISFVAVVGYLYHSAILYNVESFNPTAPHTAVAFIVLALGILALHPNIGWLRAFLNHGPRGTFARRMVPVAVLLPVVIGWLRMKGQEAGLYGAETGVSYMVLFVVAMLIGIIWWIAESLHGADKQRKQIEEMMTETQRIAHIGSWRADMAGNIIWSDETYRIYGVSPATFTPTIESLLTLIHPDDRSPLQTWLQECLAGKKPGDHEFRIVLNDGTVRYQRGRGELVYDNENKSSYVAGTVQDITERKTVEEKLHHSEALYRTLFENVPVGVGMADHEGNILAYNDELLRQSGYQRGTDEIRNVSQFYADLADRKAVLEKLQNERFVYQYPVQFKRKDGTTYPALLSLRRVEIQGKQRTLAVVEDITEKTRAQEVLRESEERFRMVAVHTGQLIYDYNTKTGAIQWAGAIESMTGYTPMEMESFDINQWAEHLHPDDKEKVMNYLDESLKNCTPFHVEYRFRKKDGSYITVEDSGTFLYDANVKFHRMLGAMKDITERKHAESALRESEEKYRELVNGSMDGITIIQDGKVQFVNPTLAKLRGEPIETILGSDFLNFVHPDERPKIAERYRKRIAGEQIPHMYETVLLRNDGTKVHVELSASLISYQGKPADQIMVRDITKRKQMEEERRVAQERYHNLIQSARDAIFTLSPSGIIISLNHWFETPTGWKEEEWIGKSFTELIHPNDLARARELFARTLAGEQIPLNELRVKTKGGDYAVGEFTLTTEMENGKIVGILGIARDVTARKKLEQELRQIQKMESIGTLAGGVAHDFNNILAIIIGNASLIQRTTLDRQRFESSMESIVQAATRGANLVRQLLTFARKTDSAMEYLIINDTIKEVIKLVRETFPKIIRVSDNLHSDLPVITADATQMHQVLLNLCINARDAMLPKGGTLTISSSLIQREKIAGKFPSAKVREYVQLSVEDTGIGMDEQTRSRIFEPFFTTKEPGKGTGLGLSTVFGIVQTHNGFIDVISSVGKGTTFHVYLPVPQSEISKAEMERTMVEPEGGTETILVVEDEEMLRTLTQMTLEQKGYSVLTAEDSEQALDIFRKHKETINAVVSDFGLPKFDGYELYQKLKTIEPDVRFIIASGFVEPNEKSEMLKNGVLDFIQKPYNANELLSKVRAVLDLKKRT